MVDDHTAIVAHGGKHPGICCAPHSRIHWVLVLLIAMDNLIMGRGHMTGGEEESMSSHCPFSWRLQAERLCWSKWGRGKEIGMMLCRKGSTGSVFYSLSGPGISGLYYIQLASCCTFLVTEESLHIMVKSGRPNNTICDLLYSSIKGYWLSK